MEFTEPVSLVSALLPILPEIGLTILALIILTIDMTTPEDRRGNIGLIAAVGVVVILVVNLLLGGPRASDLEGQLVLGGMLRHDTLGLIFRTMVLLAAALAVSISISSAGALAV